MNDLTTRNFFRSPLANWSRWIDDFDSTVQAQRGLKIYETDKNLIVEAIIAGVPSENVEVHIEDGVLTIKAEKTSEEKTGNEYSSTSYQYYYTTALSGGQWDKADAEVENGVLTLTIPKTPAARPRTITVKSKSK